MGTGEKDYLVRTKNLSCRSHDLAVVIQLPIVKQLIIIRNFAIANLCNPGM